MRSSLVSLPSWDRPTSLEALNQEWRTLQAYRAQIFAAELHWRPMWKPVVIFLGLAVLTLLKFTAAPHQASAWGVPMLGALGMLAWLIHRNAPYDRACRAFAPHQKRSWDLTPMTPSAEALARWHAHPVTSAYATACATSAIGWRQGDYRCLEAQWNRVRGEKQA